jgi:hypothetical protein
LPKVAKRNKAKLLHFQYFQYACSRAFLPHSYLMPSKTFMFMFYIFVLNWRMPLFLK